MKSRGLRAVLVLLAVAALSGAGYFAYLREVQAQAARTTQRAFERDVARLQAVIAEVRASLPGYVAAGQDAGFWADKVSQLLQDAQTRTASLERAGITSEASQHIGTAEESVAMLQQQEARIRDLLEKGLNADASRLIFSEAFQLCTSASLALSQAATLQAARTMEDIAAQRWNEIYGLAGAAGLAFLVLLLLVPRAIVEAQAPELEPTQVLAPFAEARIRLEAAGRDGLDLDLADRPRRPDSRLSNPPDPAPPVRPAPSAARTPPPTPAPAAMSPAAATTNAAGTAAPPATPAVPGPVPLETVAVLCTDLARVTDTEQLQQMLGRAASLLDATGIVIWLTAGESSLRPAFSYGYSPQALARMQTLGHDEENAVSSAFRDARRKVVAGTDGRNGALVTPLLSPSGCVGAMAAETKDGGESRPATQALAAIIAAQLATIMPAEDPTGAG